MQVGSPASYATSVKKISVYLDDERAAQLKQLAEIERRSQSQVVRDAILLYASRANPPPRTFAMAGITAGVAQRLGYRSIADVPEEVLLEGFGES